MKGACLCGAITVTTADHHQISLCHCSICRHWGSGPMFALHCGVDVQFEGASPARYRSSSWAERGFCAICGTHLFYHLPDSGQYILSAGLFEAEALMLTSQIFIDEKPAYYTLANRTEELTGAQVFAQFAAAQS